MSAKSQSCWKKLKKKELEVENLAEEKAQSKCFIYILYSTFMCTQGQVVLMGIGVKHQPSTKPTKRSLLTELPSKTLILNKHILSEGIHHITLKHYVIFLSFLLRSGWLIRWKAEPMQPQQHEQ